MQAKGKNKMIKTPDIQDILDVDRFAARTYYPKRRDPDGNVPEVYYIRGAHGPTAINASTFRASDGARIDDLISFDAFLALEQGYYKSRFVEYNGSIVYLLNTGADENSRNHSYRPERIQLSHHHPDVTGDFTSRQGYQQAMSGLSTHRTAPNVAIDLLESGKVIGCALSDNFGLITSYKTPNIQLVRRHRIIGELINGYPSLYPGYEHYFYAVNKLWR